jgi:hypothetical protein
MTICCGGKPEPIIEKNRKQQNEEEGVMEMMQPHDSGADDDDGDVFPSHVDYGLDDEEEISKM